MARGDQIYAYRELFNLQGLYEHHGIDCGDGSAIHYRKPSEIIERTSLDTFARGNRIYVREYASGFCFIPDVVIQRAESRLGEQKYNLLFNNCEHFATWCKTGISNSQQIQDFVPIVTQLNVDRLYDPLQEALQASDPHNTQRLLEEALADIRVVWNDVQPQYQTALKEINAWQKVAQEALKRDRDDLARAALHKKLTYQKQATQHKQQLDQLAMMTEDVLKDLLNGKNLSTINF